MPENSPTYRFYARIKSHITRDSDLLDFFTYHLTVEMEHPAATVKAVRACYEACDLACPSWIASHFSKGLKQKPRRFVKTSVGYRLENSRREGINKILGDSLPNSDVTSALNVLESQVPVGPKRDFLHETINCFGVKAYRAGVVMCWNLAMHHLQDFILADASRHASFNSVLARNTDTRVKIKAINKGDDFTEMSESKFLLFCRESKVITASVYNKLEGRLHERNSAAHPSGVKITAKAAEVYIEDLVENVIKKFVI